MYLLDFFSVSICEVPHAIKKYVVIHIKYPYIKCVHIFACMWLRTLFDHLDGFLFLLLQNALHWRSLGMILNGLPSLFLCHFLTDSLTLSSNTSIIVFFFIISQNSFSFSITFRQHLCVSCLKYIFLLSV